MKLQFENTRKCILTIENSDEAFARFNNPTADTVANTINAIMMEMYDKGEPNVVEFMKSVLSGQDGIQSDAYGDAEKVQIVMNKLSFDELQKMALEQGNEQMAQEIKDFYENDDIENESCETVEEIDADCLYHFKSLDTLIRVSKLLSAKFDVYKINKDYCILVSQDSTDDQWDNEQAIVEYSDCTEFFENELVTSHFREHNTPITSTEVLKQI